MFLLFRMSMTYRIHYSVLTIELYFKMFFLCFCLFLYAIFIFVFGRFMCVESNGMSKHIIDL